MTVSETISDSVSETVDSTTLAALFRRLPLEPRCRVWRNDVLRAKVNGLLAAGASYAMILRTIEDDNTKLDKRDRVTIDSIRNHTARHFPVQNVAKATYREILERRAKENGVDFVEGVATAITCVTGSRSTSSTRSRRCPRFARSTAPPPIRSTSWSR
jgi:hypothetical protein